MESINDNIEHKFTKKAIDVLNLGLIPIPKIGKRNPPNSNLNEPSTNWNYKNYPDLGFYTGKTVNTLAIDIDYPDKCKIFDLLSPSLVIWHGNGIAKDVLTGKKEDQ